MKAFTSFLTPQEARAAFARVYQRQPLGTERVTLLEAAGRILADDVTAAEDLPAFDKSTVDGYAVQAAETAGASSGTPVRLKVVGEVAMGGRPLTPAGRGEAVRIPTGGPLPPEADAVVMQEHTVRHDSALSVEHAVRPGENVVHRGADVRAGDLVLRAGRRLRPADVGLLAGLGQAAVGVFVRPVVALIVTGDELIAPGGTPRGGQIFDMNTYTLSGTIAAAGCVPKSFGIAGDNLAVLTGLARDAWQSADAVIVSGGSSVGEKDYVADAIAALGDPGIIVHGIAIRPGKPTILAVAGGKPVFGLPGNVVSVLVTFDEFVRPVLDQLTGWDEPPAAGSTVRARLSARLSARDREDHVRVELSERDGVLWASPLPGASAVITTMVKANGIVVVPIGATIEAGTDVEVRFFG